MGNELAKRLGAERQQSLPLFRPEAITIITDKKHPMYDSRVELPLKESFVESVYKYGILEPAKVRANGKNKNGEPILEAVDGRQRIRACIEANKRRKKEGLDPWLVPAIVVIGNDNELYGKITLMLNEQRQGNTTMYRARQALKLHEQGFNKGEIAVFIAASTKTVDHLFKLLNCPPEVQEQVELGNLAIELALTMADMPREKQVEALAKMLEEAKAAGKDIKSGLRGQKGKKALENASGKETTTALGKRQIQRELEIAVFTVESNRSEGNDDPKAAMYRDALKYVLGLTKRRPCKLVEPPETEKPKKARKNSKEVLGSDEDEISVDLDSDELEEAEA